MVSIVVPLPPANADTADTIPDREGCGSVEVGFVEERGVSGIVADPATLGPHAAEKESREDVDSRTVREKHTRDRESEHDGYGGEDSVVDGQVFLEEACFL